MCELAACSFDAQLWRDHCLQMVSASIKSTQTIDVQRW
jgi:hypothetical protein